MSSLIEKMQEHPILYKGQKVVTLPMIDETHERPSGTAHRSFNSNRARFVEGEDYWEFGATANVLRGQLVKAGYLKKGTSNFILLSESGYLKTTKPMRDDKSWDAFNEVIKVYFRAKEIAEESVSKGEVLELLEAQSAYHDKMFKLILSFSGKALATARNHRPKNPNQNELPFIGGQKSLGES